MRPLATSVRGLKPLVYEALSYEGLKLLAFSPPDIVPIFWSALEPEMPREPRTLRARSLLIVGSFFCTVSSTTSNATASRSRSCQHASACVSIRQHASAHVSIRQHTSACVSIRQHTSAYVSMRQHASAYISMRQHTSACVSIPQHASAYVRF
jgi:hypothetical protein